MAGIGVKPYKITLLDADRVKIFAQDGKGEEHAWVLNVKHFIEFLPAMFSFANDVNKHYSTLAPQTLIAHEVTEISLGNLTNKEDVALTMSLKDSVKLHFHFSRILASQLYEGLSVLLGFSKTEKPSVIN